MSAYTARLLDGLRDRALTIGTDAQRRFRVAAYVQARSVTPGLVVWWHDVSGLVLRRVTWAQRRRLAAVTEEVRRG